MATKKKVKVTVLPYKGKPKETAAELRKKNWKPLTVLTDGVVRKPARINEREE